MDAQNANVRKSININKTLEKKVQREADKYGFTFGEYVKFTLAKAIEKTDESYNTLGSIPPQLEKIWVAESDEIVKEIRQGKRKPLTTAQELRNRLNGK